MVTELTDILPTHAGGFTPPPAAAVDVPAEAQAFLDALAKAAEAGDGEAFAKLFHPTGYWRDVLVFSREYRMLVGGKIALAANELFPRNKPSNFNLSTVTSPILESPFPDITRIRVTFTFETDLGHASGIARLIYDEQVGRWRAYTVYTVLEDIHGHPQQIGANRPYGKHNDKETHDQRRAREVEFKDGDPQVLIIGAGHNGLACAAVLQSYGVSALVIDREERLGDNWRKRYASLSLHDPVHTDHMPLLPFPANWPTFMSAGKLANWLESYADSMECNVWLRTTVDPARSRYDDKTKQWEFTIIRTLADNSVVERNVKVSHVILCTGLVGGKAKLPPPFPGQENWGGKIVHSSGHKGGAEWRGKRALVVGACTSAHDISVDLVNNGVDATMLQRSPTFIMSIDKGVVSLCGNIFTEENIAKQGVDVCDRISDSIPKPVAKEFQKRITVWLSEEDKEIITGLKNAGFKTYPGPEGTGWFFLAFGRAGGYYFTAGEGSGSDMVIKGKIKVKQGEISSFGTDKNVTFTDGTTEQYDLVILATGYTGIKDTVRETLGDKAADQLKTVWGADDEGELMGIARDAGVPHMFMSIGNFLTSRLWSKNIALQIIGQREDKWGEVYTK